MKKILVLGAGGFIGHHLVTRLKKEGHFIRGIDLKYPEFSKSLADEFLIADLRDYKSCDLLIDESFSDIFQLAADMGGAGYIFTKEHDANIMHNSAQINLNVAEIASKKNIKNIFYSSSACMYPEYNQLDPNNPKCSEDSAYPANPDSEYGWEKLFSERLYMSYNRNYNMNIHIARFHNIFGPESCYNNGKEKAPSAICRKVAEAKEGDTIEIWGDGIQTRSFLYIDECIEGVLKLMDSDFKGPVNIGSDEVISINDFAKLIIKISGKNLQIKNISGPQGVRGRKSDNTLIEEKLNWKPTQPLCIGIEKTYYWINSQLQKDSNK
jgi:GDP-D-mannose 3',5'-epimerase